MKDRREMLSLISKNKKISCFEKDVYGTVLDIPRGSTRTYKWVARKIDRPNAFRAVGNALNKNPYAVIVPCHRVIKSDGSIGGYFKGVSRKKKLLRMEGVDLRACALL